MKPEERKRRRREKEMIIKERSWRKEIKKRIKRKKK
jgi:hypothetical protein